MLDDAELRPLIDEFLHGAKEVDAEARGAVPAGVGLRRFGAWRPQRPVRAQLPRVRQDQPDRRPTRTTPTAPAPTTSSTDARRRAPSTAVMAPRPEELLAVAVAAHGSGTVLRDGLVHPRAHRTQDGPDLHRDVGRPPPQDEVVRAIRSASSTTRSSPRRPRRLRAGPPTWLVDPLDGTSNYAHGIPSPAPRGPWRTSTARWPGGPRTVPRRLFYGDAAAGRG